MKPLTAAQKLRMQQACQKWNSRLVPSNPEKEKEAKNFLMAKHFENLPHYVLD